MSKSPAYARDVQAYLFSGVRPDWDRATELFLSFHESDPGTESDQTAKETAFEGYKRFSLPRPGGFLVKGAVAALAANAMFSMRESGGDPARLMFVGIGTAATGPGKLLHSYALPRELSVEIDGAPFIGAGDLKVTEH